MNPTHLTAKRLVIQTLIVAVFCYGLIMLVGALAINPDVGEGADIAPDSFRYRVGLWFESNGMVFFVLAWWPGLLATSLSPRPPGIWVSYLFFLVTGLGWVLLWHFGVFMFRSDLARAEKLMRWKK